MCLWKWVSQHTTHSLRYTIFYSKIYLLLLYLFFELLIFSRFINLMIYDILRIYHCTQQHPVLWWSGEYEGSRGKLITICTFLTGLTECDAKLRIFYFQRLMSEIECFCYKSAIFGILQPICPTGDVYIFTPYGSMAIGLSNNYYLHFSIFF